MSNPTPENVIVPAPYTVPERSNVEQGKLTILASNARIEAIRAEREKAEK